MQISLEKQIRLTREQTKLVNAGMDPLCYLVMPVSPDVIPYGRDFVETIPSGKVTILEQTHEIVLEVTEVDALLLLTNMLEMQWILDRYNKESVTHKMELPYYLVSRDKEFGDSERLIPKRVLGPFSSAVDRSRIKTGNVVLEVRDGGLELVLNVEMKTGPGLLAERVDFSCSLGTSFFYHVFRRFPSLMEGYTESVPLEHAALIHAELIGCETPQFKMCSAENSVWDIPACAGGDPWEVFEEGNELRLVATLVSNMNPNDKHRGVITTQIKDFS